MLRQLLQDLLPGRLRGPGRGCRHAIVVGGFRRFERKGMGPHHGCWPRHPRLRAGVLGQRHHVASDQPQEPQPEARRGLQLRPVPVRLLQLRQRHPRPSVVGGHHRPVHHPPERPGREGPRRQLPGGARDATDALLFAPDGGPVHPGAQRAEAASAAGAVRSVPVHGSVQSAQHPVLATVPDVLPATQQVQQDRLRGAHGEEARPSVHGAADLLLRAGVPGAEHQGRCHHLPADDVAVHPSPSLLLAPILRGMGAAAAGRRGRAHRRMDGGQGAIRPHVRGIEEPDQHGGEQR
mmetsp:Transcript_12330/g.35755  ORF Transcript_12330/g.35755 Transcript_12330/m.35755 type:complete len:293 (-) Transcript_12330:152-1030(-)